MLKVELGIASREYNDQDTIRRFNMGETYQGNNMVSTNSFNDMNNTVVRKNRVATVHSIVIDVDIVP